MPPRLQLAAVCLVFFCLLLTASFAGLIPHAMDMLLALPVLALWLLHRRAASAQTAAEPREAESQTRLVGRVRLASSEIFSFSIEPNANGSYGLCLRMESRGVNAMIRIGDWPNAEKARQIAERIAAQLSGGAQVMWQAPQTALEAGARQAAE